MVVLILILYLNEKNIIDHYKFLIIGFIHQYSNEIIEQTPTSSMFISKSLKLFSKHEDLVLVLVIL